MIRIGNWRRKASPGIAFVDLPEEWRCPNCGAGTKAFHPFADHGTIGAEGLCIQTGERNGST